MNSPWTFFPILEEFSTANGIPDCQLVAASLLFWERGRVELALLMESQAAATSIDHACHLRPVRQHEWLTT